MTGKPLKKISRRKRRERTITQDATTEQSTELPVNIWERATAVAASKQSSDNNSTLSTTITNEPSTEHNRERRSKIAKAINGFIQRTLSKGVEGIKEEYMSVPKVTVPADVVAFKENVQNAKNRYNDLSCLDATRVILKKHSTNYIHANYIGSVRSDQRFIVTQGPLDTTIIDFWRMIVQENVEHIVMLCDFYEDNRSKCARYFPIEKGERMMFDNYEVSCSNTCEILVDKPEIEESRAICCELKVSSRATVAKVQQYRWNQFPDRKVPKSTQTILSLLHAIRGSQSPIVVHCSTGVGRACTLVSIEMLLEELISGKDTPTVDLLRSLRRQRAHAISTDLQWLYVHKAVLDYLKQKGKLKSTSDLEKAKKFYADYQKYFEEAIKLK